MFRTISLVQCRDHKEAPALVEAARTICASDSHVRCVEASVGLQLLDHPLAPQASFSIVMDFDDQGGWQEYRKSKAHDEFQALAAPHASAVLATQYVVAVPS